MRAIMTLILGMMLLQIGGACTPEKKIKIKNEKRYGVTKGLFRSRWWNFYERGISYGDGGFFDEAEADFKEAIKQRDTDQRMARTYGMHFIDYFPHRELGILYYHKKVFRDAVKELEISLSGQESAKAKYYLNKARAALIRQQTVDTLPPRIQITSAGQHGVTNQAYMMVSGNAADPHYVSAVHIKGVPEFIELAEKKIYFSRQVKLKPGENRIPVMATDLLGNTRQETLSILADFEGPNLSVLNYQDNQHIHIDEITLKLSYLDTTGLDYLRINGISQSTENELTGILSTKVKLNTGENQIHIEAGDKAGNKTIGALSLYYYPGPLTAQNTYGPSAFSFGTDVVARCSSSSAKDLSPPDILFKGLVKVLADHAPLTITDWKKRNRFFIEGQVSDAHAVEEIRINGEPITVNKGKTIVFSKFVDFPEGENQFIVFARDSSGNHTEKSVSVNRKIRDIDLDESKMTVSIIPFKTTTVSPGLGDSFEHLFSQEIINSRRFNVVERGSEFEDVLRELNLSNTGLVDKRQAVRAGRLLAAEAVITGSIVEKENEVEVYSRIINVETSEYIAAHDVYGRDKSRPHLEILSAGLASEIVYAVPLVEGQVLSVKNNQYYLNIGSNHHFNLKKGLKCIAYQSEPFILDGVKLGEDTTILGTLIIDRINSKFSVAKIASAATARNSDLKIKKSDKIITK